MRLSPGKNAVILWSVATAVTSVLPSFIPSVACAQTVSTGVPRARMVAPDDATLVKTSLGSKRGEPKFRQDADLNGDGIVNVLDAALSRVAVESQRQGAHQSSSRGNAAGPAEQIIIEPQSTIALPNGTVSILFLIRNNTTPLLGYSLDVEVVPGPGARGSVTANIALTNFFGVQNLIAAGCSTLDSFFSVIQDSGDGGVFINAITADNSTCLAVDGVNDVLAEVVFDVSSDACGRFTIQLGAASALSDGDAFPVVYDFSPGEIFVSASSPELELIAGDVSTKNRFLSVRAGDAGRVQALRVTATNLPTPFEAWSGQRWFAGTPFQACENSGQGLNVTPPNCGPAPGLDQAWFWAAPLVCSELSAAVMDWTTLSDYCVAGANDGGACSDVSECPGGLCGSDGLVHLYHEGIVPSTLATSTGPIASPASYDLQAIDSNCGLTSESSYSVPATAVQAGWGDIIRDVTQCPNGPPNVSVDVLGDVVSLVNKFSNLPCSIKKARGDLLPNNINFKIDFVDVLGSLAAFAGGDYPSVPKNPEDACAIGVGRQNR